MIFVRKQSVPTNLKQTVSSTKFGKKKSPVKLTFESE